MQIRPLLIPKRNMDGGNMTEPASKHAEPLSYTIDGAMRATGLGRSKLYELMASETLIKLKVGKRTLIRADSLRALIDGAA